MLTLVDNRSSVQLAAAGGSARNTDFGVLGALLAGADKSTAQGKVLIAAASDSLNGLTDAVRQYKAREILLICQFFRGRAATGAQSSRIDFRFLFWHTCKHTFRCK